MSILIKGMKMPTGEACVTVRIWSDGRAVGVHNTSFVWKAVPVPPHGDLIDRDELLSQYGGPIWTEKTDYAEGLRDVVADIKNAPTVIEAEEGE